MSGTLYRSVSILAVVAALALAGCGAPPAGVATATPPAGDATSTVPAGEVTATPRPPATAIAGSPAAGICADFQEPLVTLLLGGRVPTPRCVRVLPAQHLAVENGYNEAINVSLGGIEADVGPGATYVFGPSLGEFLAPGVHRLSAPASSGDVEIWLVSGPSPTRAAATDSPVPPGPEPSPTPATGPSADAQFLYGSGPEAAPELFAGSADKTSVGLGRTVFPGAIASRSGRWIATPNGYPDAGGVRVYDLDADKAADYAATERYRVYGLAFDPAESRLAFLELAPAEVENIPWAIVVVRLQDGVTTRFPASTLPELNRYPGNPLGWTAPGDELLIATFLPYSDGLYAGVWAIALPPDTPGAMLTGLTPRVLVPGGGYRSVPRLSPDGTRLLYLARDPDYMPADFEPIEDFAANQLWVLDLASGQPTLLYEVTNGDALLRDAAWSPDGRDILFAQGHFAGSDFGTLTLKILDPAGRVRDAPAVPVAPETYAVGLHWCRADLALVQWMAREPLLKLAAVDPGGTGEWWSPRAGELAFMAGCVE